MVKIQYNGLKQGKDDEGGLYLCAVCANLPKEQKKRRDGNHKDTEHCNKLQFAIEQFVKINMKIANFLFNFQFRCLYFSIRSSYCIILQHNIYYQAFFCTKHVFLHRHPGCLSTGNIPRKNGTCFFPVRWTQRIAPNH